MFCKLLWDAINIKNLWRIIMNGLKFLAMCALSAGMAFSGINSAEAAKVALLPLVNNVVDREDLNQIYYDRAVSATKQAEDSELVENTEVDAVGDKFVKLGQLPDQEALAELAQKSGSDLVVMMQVDEMSYHKKSTNPNSDGLVLNLKGRLVAFDNIQGKFINKRIDDEDECKESLTARYDVLGDQFAKSVTREMKRLLGVKKVTFEKPKISKAGFKGDRK